MADRTPAKIGRRMKKLEKFGSQIVAVQDLGLKYNVVGLITKGLSIDEIRLDKPVIYLRREGDTWELSRLVKKQETEADRSGPAKPIEDSMPVLRIDALRLPFD